MESSFFLSDSNALLESQSSKRFTADYDSTSFFFKRKQGEKE